MDFSLQGKEMTYLLYDLSNTHEFHRGAIRGAVASVNAEIQSDTPIAVLVGSRNMIKFLPKIVFSKINCVVSLVGFGRLYTDYGFFGRFLFLSIVWIYAKTRALAFIVEHESDKKVIEKVVKSDVYTTHGSGLDASSFFAIEKRRGPGLRLGYLSRFVASKGANEILRIANRLPKDRELIIAGWDVAGHKFADAFQKIAEERANITFLGKLHSRAEVSEFMNRIDLFLSPSVREGGNISLQEAIWHEVPFVTTDVPGCDVLANLFKCPAIPMAEFSDFILGDKVMEIHPDTSNWRERLTPFMSKSVEAELKTILTDVFQKTKQS